MKIFQSSSRPIFALYKKFGKIWKSGFHLIVFYFSIQRQLFGKQIQGNRRPIHYHCDFGPRVRQWDQNDQAKTIGAIVYD